MHADWNTDDLISFCSSRESKRLEDFLAVQSGPSDHVSFSVNNGWKHSSIKLSIPADGHQTSEDLAPTFNVPGLAHRSLRAVIEGILQSPAAESFTLHPYKAYWRPSPNSAPEQIFTETFTADFFIDEYMKVRQMPEIDGIENVIFGISIWSDSTHLTNFGKASLWPIYLYPTNQLKDIRGKPTCFSESHIAYIPPIPDEFQDWYTETFGVPASAEILRFLRRELFMAVWLCLLDPNFMDAYLHGILS
ncbi:hypothetical protein C0991_009404, partial [Blastosporella zonata]